MNSSKTNELLKSIKNDVNTIAQKKILFNAHLTDGTNEYLTRGDYSNENAIDFYWQNDKETPVYIYKYNFSYTQTSEPTDIQLYHSTAWESKIGALNSDESDYEAPYITKKNNIEYYNDTNPNHTKMQWTSNPGWTFRHDFNEAPIEIGISRKFGHYIQANINTGNYDTDPVGIIEGYYYSS